MTTHAHQFWTYDPHTDRWVCRCRMGMDRLGGLWHADGTPAQRRVVVAADDRDRYHEPLTMTLGVDPRDAGVRSGRERLTC